MSETNLTIKILNLNNKTFNFNNLLLSNNSILIKNCQNLNIFISSKINKITIENSQQIIITISKLIIGFEISKSNFILINSIDKNLIIPFIGSYKSSIYLIGDISLFLKVIIYSELSQIYNIS